MQVLLQLSRNLAEMLSPMSILLARKNVLFFEEVNPFKLVDSLTCGLVDLIKKELASVIGAVFIGFDIDKNVVSGESRTHIVLDIVD